MSTSSHAIDRSDLAVLWAILGFSLLAYGGHTAFALYETLVVSFFGAVGIGSGLMLGPVSGWWLASSAGVALASLGLMVSAAVEKDAGSRWRWWAGLAGGVMVLLTRLFEGETAFHTLGGSWAAATIAERAFLWPAWAWVRIVLFVGIWFLALEAYAVTRACYRRSPPAAAVGGV